MHTRASAGLSRRSAHGRTELRERRQGQAASSKNDAQEDGAGYKTAHVHISNKKGVNQHRTVRGLF